MNKTVKTIMSSWNWCSESF